MEVKKSKHADLERKRGWRLVFGLVVSLGMFLAVLELSWKENANPEMDLDTLKEIVEDLNVEEDRDRIPLLKEEEYEKSEKLVVADVDEPQELLVTPEQTGDAESEGDDQSEETPEPPQLTDQFDNPLHFRIVEELPEFPGGASEFVRFLTTHLRYPAVAQRKKLQGKVIAQFIVNIDGSISDLKVTKSLSAECDREALRVLRMMPQWKPGIDKGNPCRTMVCVPIVFKM